MTEAPHEVEAGALAIFRQRRHALLVLRPLASSELADPALEGDCEAAGVVGALRLAFADGALSLDSVFAALLGGGPLSAAAPFVYLIGEGNGIRVLARGPLRVVELPHAPQVGIRPAVISAGEALTWVEALLPSARGVEVTVEDTRRGIDEVPIQLLFAEHEDGSFETIAPSRETPEATADPDLDGAIGPGEAVREESPTSQHGGNAADVVAADAAEGIQEATIVELPSEEPAGGDHAEPQDPAKRDAETFPVPIIDADAHADLIGEHDGRTILSDEASRIRQAASARRAARQEQQADGDSRTASPELGEHDGLTVAGSSLHALRGGAATHEGLGDLGETVLAQALSFETHPEGGASAYVAPTAPPVSAPPAPAPRTSAPPAPAPRTSAPQPPELRSAHGEAQYIVELSTGGTVELTGPLVLGRAPSMGSEQTAGIQPHHVTLSGATDISRNHVLLTVEGGVIVVTDLHSRNGTDVVMPGRGPQRLRAGEPTAVMPGTVVDLGSGIYLTVRNLAMTVRH
ncbi:MAG: FHA domain-containing protein [Pseudoclavibacter sp.]